MVERDSTALIHGLSRQLPVYRGCGVAQRLPIVVRRICVPVMMSMMQWRVHAADCYVPDAVTENGPLLLLVAGALAEAMAIAQ
jgi:hypothetical protein